jgi:succinyl-diaminopimelate desuccinylase
MSRTLALAEQLIARPSATPEDAGCLELIVSHLEPLGFQCERMDSGPDTFHVSNLWAIKRSKRSQCENTGSLQVTPM